MKYIASDFKHWEMLFDVRPSVRERLTRQYQGDVIWVQYDRTLLDTLEYLALIYCKGSRTVMTLMLDEGLIEFHQLYARNPD